MFLFAPVWQPGAELGPGLFIVSQKSGSRGRPFLLEDITMNGLTGEFTQNFLHNYVVEKYSFFVSNVTLVLI